jgi:hypothetical protein
VHVHHTVHHTPNRPDPAQPPTAQSLQDARFTLAGRAVPLPDPDRAAAREAYLAKYPNAFYVDFGDFRWFRVEEVKGGRFVGGFGRVASVGAAGRWDVESWI